MKSKRSDIRITRKSGKSVPVSSRVKQSQHPHSTRSKACSKRSDARLKKVSTSKAVKTGSTTSSTDVAIKDISATIISDKKRKRIDTSEYIKRRFLYDTEVPRSVAHKRTVVADVDTPSSTISYRKRRHDTVKSRKSSSTSRTRHRRSIKHTVHNSIPSVSDSTSSPRESSSEKKQVLTKTHTHAKDMQINYSKAPHSTWELPDLLDSEMSRSNGAHLSTSRKFNVAHFRKHRCFSPGDYSDIPFGRLRVPADERSCLDHSQYANHSRLVPKKYQSQESISSDHLDENTKSELLDAESVLSHDQSSPEGSQPDDIINLCSYRRTTQLGKYRHMELLDADGRYPHSNDSHDMSEEQNQLPNEEVEEEDLLAPELSILAGPTTVTGAGIVSNITESGAILTLSSATSGSRRKSPVRPMQVLRTKSSVAPTTVFGSTSGNSTLFTEDVLPPVYQQQHSSPDNGHTGLKSASVVKVNTLSNSSSTAITIRPLRDRTDSGSHSEDFNKASSPMLPSVLTQTTRSPQSSALSRAFHNTNSGRPTGPTPAKPALSTHSSVTSRRRPSILKRSSVTPTTTEDETDTSRVSNPRTIGAFTPSALLSHKLSAFIQTPVSRTNVTSGLSGESSVASTSVASTKLFQLVTSTSVASSKVSTTHLTASDKLFGRRPQTNQSGKTSLLLSTGHSQYVDTVDSRMTTNANVTGGGGPYRYAILRGSTNGKRYIVLGNHGVFDRATIPPVVSSTPVTTSTTKTDSVNNGRDTLASHLSTAPPTKSPDVITCDEQTNFVTPLHASSDTQSLPPSDLSRNHTTFTGITSSVLTSNITSVAAI